MIDLKIPISEATIRTLKVGDEVSISGQIITGRDAAHTWLLESDKEEVNKILKESIIYHCGPVVKKVKNGEWSFVAAGPTTSIREEPYEYEVIKRYGIRAILGKGGMGDLTSKALSEFGAVYLHAIGGAASLIAQSVIKVNDVLQLKEFGVPEALWIIEVKNFKAVVTMDSHGGSLHAVVKARSTRIAKKLIKEN